MIVSYSGWCDPSSIIFIFDSKSALVLLSPGTLGAQLVFLFLFFFEEVCICHSVFWLLLIHIYDHISISVSDSRFMHASLFLVISMLFLKSVIPCVKLVASFVQICVSLGKII